MGRRHALSTLAITAAMVATAAVAPAAAASAPSEGAVCTSMKTDVHQVNNPRTEASLVTSYTSELGGSAVRNGFTDDLGVVFKAAGFPKPGLQPVYRLWGPKSGDFLWAMSEGDQKLALRLGYVLQSANFWASPTPLSCGIPVYRYLKGNKHRMAASAEYRAELEADGWTSEGVRFWAAEPPGWTEPQTPAEPAPPADPEPQPPVDPEPPAEPEPQPPADPEPEPPAEPQPPADDDDDDTTFSIAVMPDTQQDVLGSKRLTNRAEWLVDNRQDLDLQFVMHTGDVVNWDTPAHEQYANASRSLEILDDAGIPTALTIGNHDTYAVGVGGSARDSRYTRKYVRDTATFNRYFSTDRYDPEGTFEAGKIDNNYQLFSAGGEDWMILTLELWPRAAAVDWARGVVAAHPDHNVIVQTHSYLTESGSIDGSAGYGDTSPNTLYKRLISVYPNIRMVLSGHVGDAASRVDVGANGNKIVSFLECFHSSTYNHIRLLEIDTAADTVSTEIYSPINNRTFSQYAGTFDGMTFD